MEKKSFLKLISVTQYYERDTEDIPWLEMMKRR
jgi:hypothetical protein